jgi:hypothetical protein
VHLCRDDEVRAQPTTVAKMKLACRIGADRHRARNDLGAFFLCGVTQNPDQHLADEDVNARLARERALLHDATSCIDALRALEPAAMWQQLIENAVFLEHLGCVVLDIKAGTAVTDFLRALVHPNGPPLPGEHHSAGKAADAAAGNLGMALHG